MAFTSKELFEKMLLIRRVEETLLKMFEQGKLRGTTHTSIGQETCSVGVLSAINQDIDVVFSNHRCHGHFLAYGGPLELLLGELMGKKIGACLGIGGSQHLHYRNFYTNGIQGGIVPAAVGMAFAEKKKQTGAVVVVFLGDGTLGEGVVYESFNIASLWNLPILFVIEANGYAQTTPTTLQLAGRIIDRPAAFGIKTDEFIDLDPYEIYTHCLESLQQIRFSNQPECLVLHTYRLGPHSKGDDTRSPEEISRATEKDPLNQMMKAMPVDELMDIEKCVQTQIEQALRICEQSEDIAHREFEEIAGLV